MPIEAFFSLWAWCVPRLRLLVSGYISMERFKGGNWEKKNILFGPWIVVVTCRCSLWIMHIDTWPWSHTCWDHMALTGPQVCKWVKFCIFRQIGFTWPSFVTFKNMNMWKFLHYINKPSLFPSGLQLLKWGEVYILSPPNNFTFDDFWPWYLNFDCMNKGSHILSVNQV